MSSRGYTLLGWIVWKTLSLVVKTKVSLNRTKVGAAGVVAAVLVAGVVAAARSGDDE